MISPSPIADTVTSISNGFLRLVVQKLILLMRFDFPFALILHFEILTLKPRNIWCVGLLWFSV